MNTVYYGVTRRWLPQRPSMNGGGLPPQYPQVSVEEREGIRRGNGTGGQKNSGESGKGSEREHGM